MWGQSMASITEDEVALSRTTPDDFQHEELDPRVKVSIFKN